jgi:hypothetical protein
LILLTPSQVWQAYKDLQAGLDRARQFYTEMQETCESLKKNVEAFVENRRSEGGQLLGSIEAAKSNGASKEQERLNAVMERMRLSGSGSGSNSPAPPPPPPSAGFERDHRPAPLQSQTSWGSQPPTYNPAASPPITPRYPSTNGNGMQSPTPYPSYQQSQQSNMAAAGGNASYNPTLYGAMSPPAHQQHFSPPPSQSSYGGYQPPQQQQYGQQQQQNPQPQQQYGRQSQYGQQQQQQQQGYQLPGPPPGPPPSGDYSAMQATQYPAGPGGYAHDPRRSQTQQQQQQNGSGDPWGQLGSWK